MVSLLAEFYIIQNNINFSYTNEDCYMERIQNITYEKCQCFSEKYEIPGWFCKDESFLKYGMIHCAKEEKSLHCEVKTRTLLSKEFVTLVSSHCQNLCSQKNYLKFVSTAQWPSHMAEEKVIQEIIDYYNSQQNKTKSTLDEIAESNESTIEDLNLIKDNFLQVIIYADSVRGNQVNEDPSYPIENFMGEVGGILGLWLGGSVLTFFEPFGLSLKLVFLGIKKKCGKPKGKSSKIKNNSFENNNKLENLILQSKSSIGKLAPLDNQTKHGPNSSINTNQTCSTIGQNRSKSLSNENVWIENSLPPPPPPPKNPEQYIVNTAPIHNNNECICYLEFQQTLQPTNILYSTRIPYRNGQVENSGIRNIQEIQSPTFSITSDTPFHQANNISFNSRVQSGPEYLVPIQIQSDTIRYSR